MNTNRFYFVFTTIIFFLFSCQNGDQTNTKNEKTNQAAKKEIWFNKKIKVGHLVALDMAPLFIAKEAGFFKDEGLDVETIFFSNPGDNNVALAGGSIQFSINPFTLPYFGENSGIPMRIISAAGGIGIIQVIIQGKYDVSSIQQFVDYIKKNKGKKLKIGVLKGDTLEMIIFKMLEDNGLTYDDVEMIWFNDLLAMVQSFETNQIDVLSHIKPYTTEMIIKKDAKAITDNSEVWGYGTPNCTLSVMEDFANKYPETIKAYLRAVKKGFELAANEADKAVTLLENGNYYKVGKDVLLYAFENQPTDVILKPDYDGMMIAINDMVDAGYIKKPSKNSGEISSKFKTGA